MSVIGGLDIHRKQLTFDCLDTVAGEAVRGQVSLADREHLRAWLARFFGRAPVAFVFEGCAGWRYVTEEMAAAGIEAHLAEPADITSVDVPCRPPSANSSAAISRTCCLRSDPRIL